MINNNRCSREDFNRPKHYEILRCCSSRGVTGPTGATGLGSVTIGTTTTGVPGTSATVTNTGTSQDAVLNFTIPRGTTGVTGPTGPTERLFKSSNKIIIDSS